MSGCSDEKPAEAKQVQTVEWKTMPETFNPTRLAAIGPDACAECHADIVEEWKGSHHAWANRPVSKKLDSSAFQPARSGEVLGVGYELDETLTGPKINEIRDGKSTEHELTGVIGVDPIRQYLAVFDRGRFQTTSMTYEPSSDEWFDVFADGREPGEWGHWTGQGMNWNANCAYCHMTEYKKNLDVSDLSYDSRWLQQGIACAECHTGLEQHVKLARQPGYKADGLKLGKQAVIDNCATCHSRREQLTPDTFKPGDDYAQHFALALPSQNGLYYPDGQIRDEVFVYGSFAMSRMGHAGVTCLDCHNPHTNKTILPPENNMLCMRCHQTGLDKAPIINPTQHSHHPADSTGNQCISCHMPHTTYMQRDPRRDHGFLLPDPLLTKELGIPNACNGCHAQESVDWAIEWSEKWYGEALAEKPQRTRARAIAAAHAFEPEAYKALLDLAESEEIPAWKATYTSLLSNYTQHTNVIAYLRKELDTENAWTRAHAVSSLALAPERDISPLLLDKLSDPVMQVRIASARSLSARGEILPNGEGKSDWQQYLEFNADRPQDTFILAQQAIEQGKLERARELANMAYHLDEKNPEVMRNCAILMSMIGDLDEAESYLLQAIEIAPENPEILYSLALLSAEKGDIEDTITLLQEVVAIEPSFHRAWYNLALAYTKTGDWQAASKAIDGAAPGLAQTPAWQQVRAIIDQQLRGN